MVEYTSKAFEFFPDDKEIFALKKIAVLGHEKINKAFAIAQEAQNRRLIF